MKAFTSPQSGLVSVVYLNSRDPDRVKPVGTAYAQLDGDLLIDVPGLIQLFDPMFDQLMFSIRSITMPGEYNVGLEVGANAAMLDVGTAKISDGKVAVSLNGMPPFIGSLRVCCGVSQHFKIGVHSVH